MRHMRSRKLGSKFAILKAHDEQLLRLGMLAGRYFADRIESRLATAQKTVERLTPAKPTRKKRAMQK